MTSRHGASTPARGNLLAAFATLFPYRLAAPQNTSNLCGLPPFARNSAVRRMGHPRFVVFLESIISRDLRCPILANRGPSKRSLLGWKARVGRPQQIAPGQAIFRKATAFRPYGNSRKSRPCGMLYHLCWRPLAQPVEWSEAEPRDLNLSATGRILTTTLYQPQRRTQVSRLLQDRLRCNCYIFQRWLQLIDKCDR